MSLKTDLDAAFSERRRLLILRYLSGAPNYTRDETSLKQMLEAGGNAVGTERLRADLAFLRDSELLRVTQADTLHVASLTGRGYDAARGLTAVPGVAAPLPGE